ncbi:hypothetical protein L1987_62092 [Smallanthus sonchifolius]|uniref:Uncharacterized protein n=1 Tax=Smallanthus sonchifolius TaxID=185202 RepID=A0ACB9C9H3_9ASTR|nr:hypothetical protein L1987_62092 [Smallanthus sonchifolius]
MEQQRVRQHRPSVETMCDEHTFTASITTRVISELLKSFFDSFIYLIPSPCRISPSYSTNPFSFSLSRSIPLQKLSFRDPREQ